MADGVRDSVWRSTLATIVLAAALVCLLAAQGCRTAPPEPRADISAEQRARFAQAESLLHSPDADSRRQAAISLLSMDHPLGADVVLKALREDPDPRVRISVIRAVAFCTDHRCFGALLSAVADEDDRVQKEAADALERFTRPAEVDAVVAAIREPGTPGRQRQLLFSVLGESLAIRATPVLVEGLEDRNPAARRAAWEALQKISRRHIAPEVAPWQAWWEANAHRTREDLVVEHRGALSRELTARSREVRDLMEQHEALMVLISSPQSETPRLLLEALASPHDSVRLYSSYRLAALPREKLNGLKTDRKDYEVLRAALQDQTAAVRRNAILFIVGLDSEYRDALVRRALDDEDPAVLIPAIEAVRGSTGTEAVERLEVLLASSADAGVREAAANALGKVGVARSAAALMAALHDPQE
ncbi:MAG: HEAT repeat domain-containing protein, partial [Planctomycetota bacterium]